VPAAQYPVGIAPGARTMVIEAINERQRGSLAAARAGGVDDMKAKRASGLDCR